jgi:predicted amidohydrolase YtcJ
MMKVPTLSFLGIKPYHLTVKQYSSGYLMTQRRLLVLFIAVFLISLFLILMNVKTNVDMLLINGVVYTVNSENTITEAVAIKGNGIVAVGSTKDITKKYRSGTTIDLVGKAVYPGFIDSHAHVVSLGTILMTLNLTGTRSPEEIGSMVDEQIKKKGPDHWVRGRGWNQNSWIVKQFPTAAMLDKAAAETPVYLLHADGHAVWVNSKVLVLASITKTTKDPEGGKIIRNIRGEPTGVFIDNAIRLVESVLPPITDEEMTEAVRIAIQTCLRYGVTEIHDMGVTSQMIRIYKKLIDTKSFPFRIYAAIEGTGETWDEYKKKGPELNYGSDQLTVRAIKMYTDGALGSRGAALIEPYNDDPTTRGLTVESAVTLAAVAKEALQNNFQLVTHAIGDRGNAILLDAYEEAFKEYPEKAKQARFRDEHAQVLDEKDIPRFAALGVIPSMQPVHCTSDMRWAEARLGPKRVRNAYAWRSLLITGVIIPGGSDSPVESPNPLPGFYAAITRQDSDGIPATWRDVASGFQLSSEGILDTSQFDGGWYVHQRMTRNEALRSFTIWGAYAAFQEDTKGSIETGKLADITILSKDIMRVPVKEILTTEVEMTMVGGQIVYARLGSGASRY